MTTPKLFHQDDINYVQSLTTAEFSIGATDLEILRYSSDVKETIRKRLLEDEDGSTYCFINLENVLSQIKRWFKMFPGVQPFYDVGILRFLTSTHVMGFDCASGGELDKMANLSHNPSRIIFANPIKSVEHLKYAKQNGIYFMTLDNTEEFKKITKVYDSERAQVLVRIAVDDSFAMNPLGSKFGATLDEAKHIIVVAKNIKVDIVGVSFHVGSGCMNPIAFHLALEAAYTIFEFAKEHGMVLNYLDIGGGFPGLETVITCDEVASVVLEDLDRLFPGVTVLSEPGRYFAETSSIICCRITKATKSEENGVLKYIYRLNEGVNGVFKERISSGITIYPEAIVSDNISGPRFPSVLLGDTPSKTDAIWTKTELPKLKVGDWVCFNDFGAYSISVSSVKYPHTMIYLAKEI